MISAILHTRNRPQFLDRTLKYYNHKISFPLYIIDASDDHYFSEVQKIITNNELTFPCILLHHNPTTSIIKRILDALIKINTPFVTLVADDDFYAPSWFEKSSIFLQKSPSYVTAYGHSIFFEIENYAPYGVISKFWNHNYFPPRVWLEDDDISGRIKALSKYPISSTGWYATHRTNVLMDIVSTAYENKIDGMPFELLLHILQPIYGKVSMLDEIYLARQHNSFLVRYDSYFKKRKTLKLIKLISQKKIIDLYQIDKNTSSKLINDMLKPEINSLILSDIYSWLGYTYLKKNFPQVFFFIKNIKKVLSPQSYNTSQWLDPKLPKSPSIDINSAFIHDIQKICTYKDY